MSDPAARQLTLRQMAVCVFLIITLLIIGTLMAGLRKGTPESEFGEGRVITFFSGALLLSIAWISFRIGRVRHVAPGRSFWKPDTAIWGIMAIGFAYLALDETAQIHEFVDKALHNELNIPETNLTDRLDDAIVGLYGIVGLSAIVRYRRELIQQRQALPLLIVSFGLFFTMVALDLLTSRPDVLQTFFRPRTVRLLMSWLSVGEESAKLYAGGCFFLAFHSALLRSRQTAGSIQQPGELLAPNPQQVKRERDN